MPDYSGIPVAVPGAGDPPADFNLARAAIIELGNLVGDGSGLLTTNAAPSGYWSVIGREANNSQSCGDNGNEYAVGIALPQMTIDRVSVPVDAAVSGAVILISFRAIAHDGTIAAVPAFSVPVPLDSGGDIQATLASPVALNGMYAYTWCKVGDPSNTAKFERCPEWQFFGNLARMVGAPAWGHGPNIAILNTGVSSTSSVPNTVGLHNRDTNGPEVPALNIRTA